MIELLRQNDEFANGLYPGEALVDAFDLAGDEFAHAFVLREGPVGRVWDGVLLRPFARCLQVDLDEGGEKMTSISQQDRLANVGRILQAILDQGRRDVFAAGSDENVLLAVDDANFAVALQFDDIAGAQPALAEDAGRRGLVEQIALENA